MKLRLYLVRHAKSSWRHSDLRDVNRPLNRRGERDAPIMGQRLRSLGVQPDLLVASSAARALRTAELFAGELHFPVAEIVRDSRIYAADVPDLLDVIAGFDPAYRRVLLVGHNPGITSLALRLCDLTVENVPTCGIIGCEFAADDWREAVENGGNLLFFEYPKKNLKVSNAALETTGKLYHEEHEEHEEWN